MKFIKKHQKLLTYILAFLAITSLFFMDVGVNAVKKRFAGKPTTSKTIQETVRFYNLALEKVFKENKLSYLTNYVTDEEKDRIQLYAFNLVNNEKIQMKIKLRDLKFTNIKKTKNKAEIKTEELWENSYFKVGEPTDEASPEEKISYQMKYSLVKSQGNWLVNKVNILSEKKLKF